jgi:LPS export ABC transporter protein LptC/lipopolysaccharide transport protein LptA
MQEVTRKRAIALGLRAKVPVITRIVAFALLVSGLAVVGISYYKLRNANAEKFKPKSEKPELSKEVTGVIEGYEHHVTKDDRLYLLVKASRDVTYSDGHHELENISMAVYPSEGETPDQISAARAIVQPESNVLSFIGNVKIETKEKLKVNTEALSFDQNTGIAQTDSPVSFERENVSGSSTGAQVEEKTKRLGLRSNVQLTIAPGQAAKSAKRARPVSIKAAQAVFDQHTMVLAFTGGVTVEQEADILSGDNVTAFINEQKHLQRAEIRGNSYMRVMDPGRAAEVHSVNMDFYMDQDQRLQRALATSDIAARTLEGDADVQISGSNSLDVTFLAQGDSSLLKQMVAGGRSVITMSAPKSKANDPRAANKRLTANEVKLTWRTSGRDLEKAEANGDAELFVEPVVSSARAERKKLNAPQFDCDFFEAGNLARSCKATGGAKAALDPMQPVQNRGTRTLTSQNMTAVFLKDTQDMERVDGQGDSKFNENDRHGLAANVSYVAADETVRLRGGEPTVWDSRGRTKAIELDADLANDVSYARGKTTTTYYSQEQTNGATPFSKTKSPVYIASERGEFHHETGQAIYTGSARAWQDDNYVRGDKLTMYVNDKRMEANGHVQTAIYNAKKVPVFAAADSMFYSDPDRTIHYEGNVDIKQGTDRLTSGVADVYLLKETNEMEKTIAQRNVVLTQPNRKGAGDWVEYTSANEIAVLKGNPARVEDVEQGNTEGNRLTLSVRDGKVTADDARGPLAPGRVRSTHKIRKP